MNGHAQSHTDAGHPASSLIDACVHCGFCLPSCPTYVVDAEEMSSPRGRIYLMKAASEGRAPLTATFVQQFDNCLGCLGCVTACPAKVQYGSLIETTRHRIETQYTRPLADRWFRRAAFAIFPYPARMRLALLPLVALRPVLSLAQRTGLTHWLPTRIRALIAVAPPVTAGGLFSRTRSLAADTPRGIKVGLLTGCVQQLVFPNVNAASARVLAAEGCDVVVPEGQRCCGALSLHTGRTDEARQAARETIAAFEKAGVDTIVVNAAGCGSAMKEYDRLLGDDPAWAERAKAFSSRVRDITECLAELGPSRATKHPLPLRIVYQDACHLSHAQDVRTQPRELLASIPGVTLLKGTDELCCGSAGIYNLLEPDTARTLGRRKLEALTDDAPDVIATGNPGCRLHLDAIARQQGRHVTFRHPVELIDQSIRGEMR